MWRIVLRSLVACLIIDFARRWQPVHGSCAKEIVRFQRLALIQQTWVAPLHWKRAYERPSPCLRLWQIRFVVALRSQGIYAENSYLSLAVKAVQVLHFDPFPLGQSPGYEATEFAMSQFQPPTSAIPLPPPNVTLTSTPLIQLVVPPNGFFSLYGMDAINELLLSVEAPGVILSLNLVDASTVNATFFASNLTSLPIIEAGVVFFVPAFFAQSFQMDASCFSANLSVLNMTSSNATLLIEATTSCAPPSSTCHCFHLPSSACAYPAPFWETECLNGSWVSWTEEELLFPQSLTTINSSVIHYGAPLLLPPSFSDKAPLLCCLIFSR